MRVAVIGASGFVGGLLVPRLLDAGHEVRAVTRRPDGYAGPGQVVAADLDDVESLAAALDGVDAAYYLAHSLGGRGFAEQEADHARHLAAAAEAANLQQIIFLGGLGRDDDDLSPHLRSRRDVEHVLAQGATPVTVLRAGILVGAGSAGWEMLRQMVTQLPVLVSDGRARTRHQPIAAEDAIAYLCDVLGRDDCRGRTFEIGGADVLTYQEMARRVGEVVGQVRPMVQVPWLPEWLTTAGVEAFTDVDSSAGQDLLRSMGNEAVITDKSIAAVLPRSVLSFDDAVRAALVTETR